MRLALILGTEPLAFTRFPHSVDPKLSILYNPNHVIQVDHRTAALVPILLDNPEGFLDMTSLNLRF